MGFNIGVHSKQENDKFNCYYFIDRMFFNFVNSGEMYGEESIIIQSGIYYGLDLSPLTKFVYTWDEPTEDYINENIQKTEILLDLIISFKDRIIQDKTVCEKIKYIWTDKPYLLTEQDIQNMKKEVGETATNDFIAEMSRQQKEIDENPNPWNWYFVEGQIINDLDNLIKSLQCYKDNGVEEVFLTAG
jgi:hypothetical protein